MGREESLLRLGNMASFYGSLPEFLNALLLGEEDDLRRASGRVIPPERCG